jgi:glutamyl-tRNA reductase
VEALTRAIVNKVLHTPLTRLRQQAEREEGMACLEVARLLFGLDELEDADADSRSGRPGRAAPDDE